MKKIIMLSAFLIGLGMSAKLYAQEDLFVNNTTSCVIAVTVYYTDPCTCPGVSTGTYFVSPGTTTLPGNSGVCGTFVYRADVAVGGSSGTVGNGCGLSTSTTYTDCVPSTKNVNFTPAVLTPGSAANASIFVF